MFLKRFRKVISLTLFLVMVSVLMFTSIGFGKANKIVLRYAEVNPESDPITMAARKFSEIVKKESNGRIEIRVFSGGQLGDQKNQIQACQMGAVDIVRTQPVYLADIGVKKLNVYSLPYLFRDADHAWKVLTGSIGQKLLNDIESANVHLVGIGYYATSPRHFFFRNKKVTKLSDLKGLKLRVQTGKMYMDLVEAFGASPTPISFSELYSALQTGVVDGADNPIKGYYSGKYYEVCKYLTLDNHQIDPSVVVVSEMVWNKLKSGDKKIIEKALLESGNYFKELSQQKETEYLKDLERNGVIISNVENPKEWQDAVRPLYKKYGAGQEKLIEQIQKVK